MNSILLIFLIPFILRRELSLTDLENLGFLVVRLEGEECLQKDRKSIHGEVAGYD